MNAGCVLRVVLRAHACTPAIWDQAHDVNECRRSLQWLRHQKPSEQNV